MNHPSVSFRSTHFPFLLSSSFSSFFFRQYPSPSRALLSFFSKTDWILSLPYLRMLPRPVRILAIPLAKCSLRCAQAINAEVALCCSWVAFQLELAIIPASDGLTPQGGSRQLKIPGMKCHLYLARQLPKLFLKRLAEVAQVFKTGFIGYLGNGTPFGDEQLVSALQLDLSNERRWRHPGKCG